MTVLIDNYDSFTYNLVHLIALASADIPVVIRNNEKSWDEIVRLKPDRIVISPGPGRPDNTRDFGVSMDAIRHAKVPVLGVCLGHQGIALAFGGSVVRAEPAHGQVCDVVHRGDELFAGIPEKFQGVRYHSLIVTEPLPVDLLAIAWSEEGTLMALRHATRPLWGVQFHPESVLAEFGTDLMGNFLRARM